jgi:hypothetical protein
MNVYEPITKQKIWGIRTNQERGNYKKKPYLVQGMNTRR